MTRGNLFAKAIVVGCLLIAATCTIVAQRKRGIRAVDFRNFTYHSTLCSHELRGIGETVRVRSGQFRSGDVSFVVRQVLYSDVTGDGQEDAVISVSCGDIRSTEGFSELFLYTMKSGAATLLATLNDDVMKNDYDRYYPNSFWWGNGTVRIRNGTLEIDAAVDGSHAQPRYFATLIYRWDGRGLSLSGKPRRE